MILAGGRHWRGLSDDSDKPDDPGKPDDKDKKPPEPAPGQLSFGRDQTTAGRQVMVSISYSLPHPDFVSRRPSKPLRSLASSTGRTHDRRAQHHGADAPRADLMRAVAAKQSVSFYKQGADGAMRPVRDNETLSSK